jgi:ArsR family transcriptional regulator
MESPTDASSCKIPGEDLSKDPERAGHLAEMLKALAHPLRLRIVAVLCRDREHVSGLAQRLGVGQAVVSQQLRILRMRGLVVREHSEGFAYYRLGEPRLQELVRCMEGCSL